MHASAHRTTQPSCTVEDQSSHRRPPTNIVEEQQLDRRSNNNSETMTFFERGRRQSLRERAIQQNSFVSAFAEQSNERTDRRSWHRQRDSPLYGLGVLHEGYLHGRDAHWSIRC